MIFSFRFHFIVNTMKKQCESGESIVRSSGRIRESIRCLPRGHFQQIRQMFDKQNQKMNSSKLSETDDEKIQHSTTTNIDDIILENDEDQSLKSTDENHFHTGKTLTQKTCENKCNHLIECQRPVLSLFINHQSLIVKTKNKRLY
jgi:hypothetical protein